MPVILVLFLSDVNQNLIFSRYFEKKNNQASNLMKIRPVDELFHADRRRDGQDEALISNFFFFRKRLIGKTSNSLIVSRVMTSGAGGKEKPASWRRRKSNLVL